MSQIDKKNINLVIVMRATRAILGISQSDMAKHLGISKATLARAETMETALRTDTFFKAIEFFKERGVTIDNPGDGNSMTIKINKDAFDLAYESLMDPDKRRPDRQKK